MKINVLKFKLFVIYLFVGLISPLYISSKEVNNFSNKNDTTNILNTDYFKIYKTSSYLIGPGDVLNISVSPFNPELNTLAAVSPEGTIILPRLNEIYVKDLTVDELNNLLDQAYISYIKFPEVKTYIKEFRNVKVSVNGEVSNPGIYNLKGFYNIKFSKNNTSSLNSNIFNSNDLILSEIDNETSITANRFQLGENSYVFPTLIDAIRSAGGITEYSDLSKVEIIRKDTITNKGGKKKAILNLSRTINEGEFDQNIRIYDGDIIFVSKLNEPSYGNLSKAIKTRINPNSIKVIVSGRVNEPGALTLPLSATLNDALLVAGGPKILKGKLNFVRFNTDGTLDKRKISYSKRAKRGSFKNPLLKNNDLIFVDSSFISSSAEVINEITEPLKGLVSIYGLYKIFEED